MSKAISSYPEHMRSTVILRRMKLYNPSGSNGCGVLAAKDAFDKAKVRAGMKKESPSDIRRREKRAKLQEQSDE